MPTSLPQERTSSFLFAKKKKTSRGGGRGFGSPSKPSRSTTKQVAPSEKASSSPPPPPPVTATIPYKHEAPPEVQTKLLNTLSTSSATAAGDDNDDDTNTLLQQTVYTREYQKQVLLETLGDAGALSRKLVQVSTSPLILTVDDFIDPELCRRVASDGTGCFDLMFPETVSDALFAGQESEMDGLLFSSTTSKDHEEQIKRMNNQKEESRTPYLDGLHMDTNGQCLFRHVTAILYLNDVPKECGGATVFPLARVLPKDPALVASQQLLHDKIPHTHSPALSSSSSSLPAQATLLESRRGTDFVQDPAANTAIKIQPKAGKVVLFFSRESNGQEDPRAWHAGERLLPDKDGNVTEKRILTLFKEVNYDKPPHERETTLERFLAPMVSEQREWLQKKAAAASGSSLS